MFCPSCGTQTDPNIKFCKQCGFSLNPVRAALGRDGNTVNWNDVWLQDEIEKRERKRKKSPEEKRYEEIKAGVITTCVGVGATIFLYFLMHAVAANEPREADILRSVWLAGLVPIFIGLGLLFNGLVVSRKIVELKRRESLADAQRLAALLPTAVNSPALDTASINANALPAAQIDYSVTEHTTAKLKEKIPVPASRDTH